MNMKVKCKLDATGESELDMIAVLITSSDAMNSPSLTCIARLSAVRISVCTCYNLECADLCRTKRRQRT
jgi:hypothetical protein